MKPCHVLASLVAATAVACAGDPAEPAGPIATLELVASDSVLDVGQDLSLAAIARDAAGRVIPGASITWVSRDPATASVTSAGVLHGVAPGTLWIAITSGGVADSVRLRVRSGDLPPGRLHIRLRGALEHRGAWAGFGQFRDLLAADTGETSILGGQSLDPAGGDSILTLIVPGRLATGHSAVGRYVPGVVATLPVAYLILDGPAAGDAMFFASVHGGTLDIAAADYPPSPGLNPGVVRGVLAFRAVRLVAGPGGDPVETSDTVEAHVEFTAHWYHYLRPNVALALSGDGPVRGASLFATAQAVDDDHGGLLVWWDADFDRLPGQPIPFEVSHEFRVAPAGTGTFPVAALTPAQYGDPGAWPPVFSALYHRDDSRLALSTGGTLAITRYVAPTVAYYGEIHGTLTAPLALWSDETTVSGDTVTATATFAVQLWPLGGVPPAALRPFARDAPRAPSP